jgi:hypothetical protein
VRDPQKRLSPLYVVFYILFSPDTWRVLFGVAIAAYGTPRIMGMTEQITTLGRYVIFLMLAAIGWVVFARPARWIATRLQRFFSTP